MAMAIASSWDREKREWSKYNLIQMGQYSVLNADDRM